MRLARYRPVAITGLLLAVLLVALPAGAASLLRRTPGAMMLGPTMVWTDGTTTALFHPMMEPMQLSATTNARFAYQLSEISGPCRIRPAVRFSDDGVTWDSAQPIDSTNLAYINTETITYGSTYEDLSALTNPKSWIQVGVQAANASAGATGFCNATLRVEGKKGN